jgi:hypothetical protein
MVLLGQRHSNGWHQRIDATAAGKHLGLNPLSDKTFPWDALRWHTEIYLQKKGTLTAEEKDKRLAGLILNHAAKDVAVAACGYAMTSRAVRNLLILELSIIPDEPALSACLQMVMIARRVNPGAVTDVEASQAEVLRSVLGTRSQTLERRLEILLHLLMVDDTPSETLLSRQIASLAQTACREFAAQVEGLMSNGLWLHAYTVTRWLPALSDKVAASIAQVQVTLQILKAAFPSWRTWARWQPDPDRLRRWKRLKNQHRMSLRHLLALEGPDFESRREITLLRGIESQDAEPFSSVLGRHGLNIMLKGETANSVGDMLRRSLNAVDAASSGKLAIPYSEEPFPLFIQLVNNCIDEEALQILEGIVAIGDARVNEAVEQLLSAPDGPENLQRDAVLLLLRQLAIPQAQILRNALAPYLLDRTTKYIQRMQGELQECLRSHRPWRDSAVKLIDFGNLVQQAPWLRVLFDVDLRTSLHSSCSARAAVCNLADLRDSVEHADMSWLVNEIDEFCGDRLVRLRNTGPNRLLGALSSCWQGISDDGRRNLSLSVVSSFAKTDVLVSCSCLAQIPALTNQTVRIFNNILQKNARGDAAMACVDFARHLASETSAEIVTCWRPLLRSMIEQQKGTLVEKTLLHLSAEPWIHWITCLGSIYSDVLQNPFTAPAIPQLSLHLWVQRLCHEHLPTIKWIESMFGPGPALHSILVGGGDNETLATQLVQILEAFSKKGMGRHQPAMQTVFGHLASHQDNISEVCEALSLLPHTSHDGAMACENVLELHKQESVHIAEVLSAGWLQASHLTTVDKSALEAVMRLLNFPVDKKSRLPPAKSVETATAYFEKQVAELLEEAHRLDGLRITLRLMDPDGTTAQMESLDVRCPSFVEDVLAMVPAALVDIVEQVDGQVVELQFPLTHLTVLQRMATGVGEAQSLLVRLFVGDGTSPIGFCIHLDSDINGSEDVNHYPWMALPDGRPPQEQYCLGRTSRMAFKLSRILFRHLLQDSFPSIERIHTLMTEALNDLANSCIVCASAPFGVKLRRATYCENRECAGIFEQADPLLRLSDAWQDPTVMGLLLAMVYASAKSGNIALLPGCPVTDTTTITGLLDTLPPMTGFTAESLTLTFKVLDSSIADLLSWACCSYRGFLVSATGQLRVPNLPAGTHQFVLANAKPELEKAFAAHRAGPSRSSSRILFHGTSLDRLYPILCQGLRVCSGTPLARNGAARGNGIYMADEPSTSWHYANSNTTLDWGKSIYKNKRVLLGCEFAATSQGSGGIHVISDPSTLMVRYVFLFPAAAAAPLAAHMTPAMISGIASLR